MSLLAATIRDMDVRRKISTIGAAAVLLVALGTGGYAFASTAPAAPAPTPTVSATPTDSGPDLVERAQIATQQAAEEAAAQAAAQAAADKAAADAAAAEAAAPKQVTSYAPGQAPKGTPIPRFIVTDPNAGNYNQLDIVDPATFCASNSGSGDIDHAVCD